MEVRFLHIEEHFQMNRYWYICKQSHENENYPELFEVIKYNASDIGELQVNLLENLGKEEICRKKYQGG